jgi:hypothetical protein
MANRYWVGGTASWDGTAGTKWAATSGGPGGETVPTSADDVFFDNLSTGTCSISGARVAKSIDCTGFTGGITGSLAGNTLTVSGGITLVAGMTYGFLGLVTISGTGTLTSGGKSFNSLTISSGTVTLGSNLSCSSNLTIVLQSINFHQQTPTQELYRLMEVQ